jgi:hypothetical protein
MINSLQTFESDKVNERIKWPVFVGVLLYCCLLTNYSSILFFSFFVPNDLLHLCSHLKKDMIGLSKDTTENIFITLSHRYPKNTL